LFVQVTETLGLVKCSGENGGNGGNGQTYTRPPDPKLLTDDQVTSQRFNSKHIVLSNLRFHEVKFLTNYHCTKSKTSITVAISYTKLCN